MHQNGWTPLFVASWNGKADVVGLLLEREATDPTAVTTSEHLDVRKGSTARSVAELKGHGDVVAVLDCGAAAST